ncbi:TetR/AcrR family transcriptional regulator [Actinomadura xylanilytica]|uniref:TetR/AcrR family transcriptional regulator n=1 Tax=Actinomadura xylanilytica TaxID=887459 RepID=UPI00255B052C|nr:TetR/AcrR family transcriptional regulator [Actinomadura xylanilytica]MDL4771820.1 TetR/AcrR family transcriptional regulator [Actinomadura xylanilytica]
MRQGQDAPVRRDALRSRQAILAAAREVFAAASSAPMSEVARRAGLGEATLYRHFPDRARLMAALADENLAVLERLATEHAGSPGAFEMLLSALVGDQTGSPELVLAIRNGSGRDEHADYGRRLRALLREPIRAAQAAGLLREDFTPEDALLIGYMVDGVLARAAQAGPATGARVLDLVWRGIGHRLADG